MKGLIILGILVPTVLFANQLTIQCAEKEEILCDFRCVPLGDLAGIHCNLKRRNKCYERCKTAKHYLGCIKGCEFRSNCSQLWSDILNYNKPIINCEGQQ